MRHAIVAPLRQEKRSAVPCLFARIKIHHQSMQAVKPTQMANRRPRTRARNTRARSFAMRARGCSLSLNPLTRVENVFQAGYRANIVPWPVTVLPTCRPRSLTLFHFTQIAVLLVRGSQKNIPSLSLSFFLLLASS